MQQLRATLTCHNNSDHCLTRLISRSAGHRMPRKTTHLARLSHTGMACMQYCCQHPHPAALIAATANNMPPAAVLASGASRYSGTDMRHTQAEDVCCHSCRRHAQCQSKSRVQTIGERRWTGQALPCHAQPDLSACCDKRMQLRSCCCCKIQCSASVMPTQCYIAVWFVNIARPKATCTHTAPLKVHGTGPDKGDQHVRPVHPSHTHYHSYKCTSC